MYKQFDLMKEQLVVSMTGFVHDPQEDSYKKAISDLHIRLAPTLSEETTVLIVNDVTTQKYKIAKTYDPPITCVSIDWLLDSKKKNKIIMNTEQYQLKKLFYGASIKLLDFDAEKSRKVEAKIIEYGGQVRVLKNNAELQQAIKNEEKISVLMTTRANFAKLRPYMEEISFPVVEFEWLEDSLRAKLCKYPFDYALNQFYICQRQPIEHYKKMKNKLENYLSKEVIDKYEHRILEDTIIYLGENVHPDLAVLLKKIIMVYGGFYLEVHSPIVTHILTEPVTEQEYGELKIFGTLVHVLRVEWLIDTIYLNKRMKEEDYFIRSFKSRINSSLHFEDRTINNNNSLSMHSQPSLPFPARKSISMTAHLQLKPKEIKVMRKYESTIFNGYCFYIESTQKKDSELSDLALKINKNGGQVYLSRINIVDGFCFYVLKDCPERKKLVDRLREDTKADPKKGGKVQIQPISHRWVTECVARSEFIDYSKVESYIYKPFDFKTPIMGFHKMIFDVLGVGDVTKLRLKELYNTLGSTRNTPNRSDLTHCLCGESYRQTARYLEIKRDNKKVKFLDYKWLLQCANAGKILDDQKFQLEREQPSSQESDVSNNMHVEIAA